MLNGRKLWRIVTIGTVCGLLAFLAACGEPEVVVEEEVVYEVVTNTPEPAAGELPAGTPTLGPWSAKPVTPQVPEASPSAAPTVAAEATPAATASWTPEPLPTPSGRRTLVIGLPDEPESLYIFSDGSASSQHVQRAFLDGPIDNVDWQYQPVILERLPSLENGDVQLQAASVRAGALYCNGLDLVAAPSALTLDRAVVTFRLKSGLLWDDGEPLAAQDSVFGWEVLCDEETPLKDYVRCEVTESYKAVDDRTVEWVGLPGCTGAGTLVSFFTPLPRHILADLVSDGGVAAIEDSAYARRPVGWGPFRLEEWVAGDHITLVRNEHYHRASEGLPVLDRVVFRFMAGYEVATTALLAGELDIIVPEGLLPSTYDDSFYPQLYALVTLAEQERLALHTVPYPLWEHIDFNVDPLGGNDFFRDVRVRQAIAYGTDRQAMIDIAMLGATSILDTLVPQEHPLHAPAEMVRQYDYQPEVARRYLTDAGWRLGNDGLLHRDGKTFSVTLVTTQAKFRERIMEIFQENMADLGIEVDVEYVPLLWAAGPDAPLKGRKFDLAQYGWYDWSLEPACELYLTSQIPGERSNWLGLNATGYSNAEYDAACIAGLGTVHADARASHFYRTQELFSEELPALPLFLRLKVSAARPEVQNYKPDASEFGELWNIEELSIAP